MKRFMNFLKKIVRFFEELPEGDVCPSCCGTKTVMQHRRPDNRPDPMDIVAMCPICKGTGRVPEYVKKEEPK